MPSRARNAAKKMDNIALYIFAAIAAAALVFIVYKFFWPKSEGFATQTQPTAPRPPPPEVKVTFFFMPGCGHCEEVDKWWPDFVTKSAAETTVKIVPNKLDGTDSRNTSQYPNVRIEAFPTFILDKGNNNYKAYDGTERSADALITAAKSYVSA